MLRARLHASSATSALAEDWRKRLEQARVELSLDGDDGAKEPCIVLLEQLPDTLLEWIRNRAARNLGRVVVVAGSACLADAGVAWQLRSAGAAQVHAHDDPHGIDAILARLRRWQAVDGLLESSALADEIVGRSPAFVTMLRELVEVAAFTTASILLIGDSGTGKERLARLVHALDPRADKRELATLDCTTVPAELAASELFGHERGAFTGALAARDGVFALADGGTLFLDEVGELPLSMQAQLLRVVQEGTFKRLGGNQWLHTRFRLVAATNRRLDEEVAGARFRLDFFHRLATWTFRVPPLRDRPGDVLVLAQHFAQQNLGAAPAAALDGGLQQLLLRRAFPGNVRELKQLMARICGRHVGPGPLTLGDVPLADLGAADGGCDRALEEAAARAALAGAGLKEIGRIARQAAIQSALDASDQNVQVASRLLRVTDRALQMDRAKRDA